MLVRQSPKALVLDRDGTLIVHVPYLADPGAVQLLPGVREALERAIGAGASLYLHTNQSGIGRGYFALPAAESCNQRLIDLLDLGAEPFRRICIAPEAPGSPSVYRKPSPAFALELMRDHGFQAGEICYLGDRGSDLATARAAGTRGVGVASGLDDLGQELRQLGLEDEFPIFDDLLSAMQHLFPSS